MRLGEQKEPPLTVGKLHQNIMADFSRPIGGIGVFVADKESASGTLQVLHPAQCCGKRK
jgi:hypothetical protein